MRESRDLTSSAAALTGARLVVAGLGWAGTILIVRSLTSVEWGYFAFLFSLLALLSVGTDLGTARVVLRLLSAENSDRAGLIGTYLALRVLLGGATYILAVLIVTLMGYPRDIVVAMSIVGISSVFASLSTGLNVIYQLQARLGVVAVASIVGQAVQFGATVAVVVIRPTLFLLLLPALLFDAVSAAYKIRRGARREHISYAVRLSTWRMLLRQGLPLALGQALITAPQTVDMLILSRLDSFVAVGAYGVAQKYAVLIWFVPNAVIMPLLPVLVSAWPGNARVFRQATNHALLLVTLVTGVVLVAFLPFARELTIFLFGAEYASVAAAARLVVLSTCLAAVVRVAATCLVAIGRNRDWVVLGAVSLTACVVANIALIPVLSFHGAAIAHLVTSCATAATMLILGRRYFSVRGLDLQGLGKVAACSCLGLGAGYLSNAALAWPLACALGVGLYAGAVRLSLVTSGAHGLILRRAS